MKNTEKMPSAFLRGLVLVLLVFGIAGLASPASAGTYEDEIKADGAKLQNGDQIKKIFTGNTYDGMSASGKEFFMFMDDDGVVLIKVIINANKEIYGKGTWSVENDLFCRKWENLRDKERRCRKVYKHSSGKIETVASEDGAFSSKGKFWEGNTQRF